MNGICIFDLLFTLLVFFLIYLSLQVTHFDIAFRCWVGCWLYSSGTCTRCRAQEVFQFQIRRLKWSWATWASQRWSTSSTPIHRTRTLSPMYIAHFFLVNSTQINYTVQYTVHIKWTILDSSYVLTRLMVRCGFLYFMNFVPWVAIFKRAFDTLKVY